MPEELPQAASAAIADQPPPPTSSPMLEYCHVQPPPWDAVKWLLGLPRPSPMTVVALVVTAWAAYCLNADHAAWVAVRRFNGSALWTIDQAGHSFSPDGKRLLVIGNYQHTIRIFDLATGANLREINDPAGGFVSANFSPDGSRIWSACALGPATLWDASTGQPVATVAPAAYGFGIEGLGTNPASPFSSNGRWLVVADELSLRIFDAHSGTLVKNLDTLNCFFPAFSPDSRYLAAVESTTHTVYIWDTQIWQRIATVGMGGGGGLSAEWNHCIAFTPDSRKLVVACATGVAEWDAATNTVATVIASPNGFWMVRLSPNGRYLISSEYGRGADFTLFDLVTAKPVAGLMPLGAGPMISPHGTRIVGSYSINYFPSLQPIQPLGGSASLRNFAWVPGQYAFIAESSDSGFADPEHTPTVLFQTRRPEAWYGILWLPKCWLVILVTMISLCLIRRDLRRWRRPSPALV